jgi:hypothetical protein
MTLLGLETFRDDVRKGMLSRIERPKAGSSYRAETFLANADEFAHDSAPRSVQVATLSKQFH